LGGRLVQIRLGGSEVGDTPKLTNGLHAKIVSDDCEQFPAGIFSPPAAAELI
jgi:hypothetical protein